MLAQKSITLAGEEFIIQTLPATRGIETAVALSHIAAGAADGIGETIGRFDDTPVNIGGIVSGLFKRLSVKETPIFIKTLVVDSVISPAIDSELYEIRFSGNYEVLYNLIVAILEHNKFIDLIKKKVSEIMDLLYEQDTTDQESTP